MEYYAVKQNDDTLKHYGVRGMRWGVRRAIKKLSKATTKEERQKAVDKLNTHREKASNKISKLDKQRPKLEKTVEKQVIKYDTKAASLNNQSAHMRSKAYGRFTSEKKARERIYKADKLQARADVLISKSNEAKAALAKNKAMTDAFKQGIRDIDAALVSKGKRYLEG